MRTDNKVLLDNADASVNFNSEAYLTDQLFGFDFQITITGSPVGTLKLQSSSDPGKPGTIPTSIDVVNWTDITGSPQAVTGAGSVVYNMSDPYFKWVRVVYTAISGSGNMTIRVNAKGF